MEPELDLKSLASQREIAEIFAPYVRERMPTASEGWIRLAESRANKKKKALGKKRGPVDRTSKLLSPLDPSLGDLDRAREWFSLKLSPEGKPVPCEWGDEGLMAKGVGTARVQLFLLLRAIEALQPENILEVGSGSGINLFVLATRFPSVRCSGLELEPDSVARAKAITQDPMLPEALCQFSPLPLDTNSAHTRIQFHHGNAAALPFADGSFDVSFTRLALEQMQDVRDQALTELRRVSRKYVVMIESFRDWNDSGIRRDYIRSKNYFDASLEDLNRYGLEPILAFNDFPSKLTLKPGIVIARVR